ncbi:MAG: methyltransferase domain-containing protein [Deltaproteobacteria bacterium]|nr:methyltransferase domain-containing protein [Deltaproteobacteria bacterium]
MPKISAFEKHADAYDQWFDDNRLLYEAELRCIRPLAPSPPGNAMEVGVGSGKFALPLHVGVGVEPSEKMAQEARSLGIDVHPGVAEALPFTNERFDFVLMVTTICFVDDVTASLRECSRVLRPGGSLVVGFVDKMSDLGRHYQDKQKRSKFYAEATFFSAQEVLTHIQDAGLRVGRIRQTLIPAEPPEAVQDGFGLGGFVAIEGVKVSL